jgi:predicted O-methyltransferase YrrM
MRSQLRFLFRALVACAASVAVSTIRAEEPSSLDLAQAHATASDEKVKPDIFYLPTPQRVVDVMLLMAEVKKDDLLYDLGSGDGRLVVTAAKTYGARGIGIEIDPALLAIARRNAARAKVEDKVEFRQQDLFTSDFKDATVITLYLLDELNRRLRPQIFAQVRPGTRVVSHAFHMGDWQPDAERKLTIEGKEYDAYFWVVPANMSGRWKVSADSGMKGIPETIVIDQTFQEISVRAADGDAVIAQGRLTGSEFYLTMSEAAGTKPVSFTGTVDGNSIKARGSRRGATFNAEREAGTEKPLEPAS